MTLFVSFLLTTVDPDKVLRVTTVLSMCYLMHIIYEKPRITIKLKIKRIDRLLAGTCPQAANHCTLF